jgi:raffinose/stachyose/melibiose transport system permease protein
VGGLGVRRRRRSGRQRAHPLAYPALAILAAFAAFPLFVLFFNSLKESSDLGSNPIGPPEDPNFGNFADAWTAGDFASTLLNSAVLAIGTGLGVTAIASLTAFALTRLRMPRSRGLLFYVFVCVAVPPQLIIVPLFFLWNDLQLTDSLFGLIVIYWAIFSPFATLLLRSYLLTLPRDFDEAGRVEGASELQVLTRIILPLARPGLLVVAVTTALFAWNEFFYAFTFIQDESLKPATASFLAFKGEFSTDWGLTSAGGLIMIAPPVLLFLSLQRRFIDGLTTGGLKA